MHFPASGIDCPAFLPPLAGFVVSAVTSTAGVSGGFLLLPFQLSVLGFTSPAVTPTNLIYNLVATPGGVYGYFREARIEWPLVELLIAGTLPGVVLGALIRMYCLPDPRWFKLFAATVLLYLGVRLAASVRGGPGRAALSTAAQPGAASLVALAVLIGLVGGIYGIGGGAIIAPFLVAVFRLPVHKIAGATLLTTFVTSAAGLAAFQLLPAPAGSGAMRPDWLLGAFFGAGGLAGTYTGARLQKHVPERWIRGFLGLIAAALAAMYAFQALL